MRKLFVSIIISFALLFNVTVVSAASVDTKTVFNTAQLKTGIIKVAYSTDADKKLKVLVEKSDKRVSYNLKNDGTTEAFPLQYGNGEYKVSVLVNIEGNKYKYISSEKVTLNLDDQKDVYLTSVQNINWDENMAAIKKAEELTKNLKSENEKVAAIYNYIVSNFKYDYDKLGKLAYDYLPNIDNTLTTNKGICYDYSSTFAAMLRSLEIPVKLVKGYAKDVNGYHAWNEVYNSETRNWETIDTTYDSQMKTAKAKYTMIKKTDEYTKVNEY